MTDGPFIHNHSPLGLLGAFVLVLRERFSAKNKLPWVWTGDSATSSIHIYSEFERQSEGDNLLPLLSVVRGPIAYQRTAVGDRDQNQSGLINRGIEYLYQMAEASFSINSFGRTVGESAMLADIVQATIAGSSKIIEEAFTLRRISPMLIQPTQRMDADVEKYLTTLDFRINIEQRWVSVPAAAVLRRYKAELQLQKDAVTYVSELIINGLEDP